jgi:hypothetical protein
LIMARREFGVEIPDEDAEARHRGRCRQLPEGTRQVRPGRLS